MLTQAYVKERLDYNPETGLFTWKRLPGNSRTINSWNTRYSGTQAGFTYNHNDELKYIKMSIDDHPYRAHRIAWLWMYGEDVERIDHIDGDGLNNRIENLRLISHGNNIRKAKIAKNNTSGMKGVSLRADTGKWTTRCKVGKQYKSLGSFETKEAAFEAYCSKVLELTGEIHLDLITKQ